MIEIKYCKKCVYPSIAVNLRLDDENICSGCRASEKSQAIGEDLPVNYWKLN